MFGSCRFGHDDSSLMSLECRAEMCQFWAALGFKNCSAMVKHIHERIGYFTSPTSLNQNKLLLPYCVLSNSIWIFNFRPLSAPWILSVPQVVWSSKLFLLLSFLVLQLFGPPKCLWSSWHVSRPTRFQEPPSHHWCQELKIFLNQDRKKESAEK